MREENSGRFPARKATSSRPNYTAIANSRLYTRDFVLLCGSHFLFAGSFTMMLAELPFYLSNMGGEAYKGLIIALFTLMAAVSRPFSGKLADTVGRIPVMVFGTLVCVVCSALYPLLTTVAGFLWLRFFHGFSTGFKPTAATAYAADIVPVHRRGEAMGILGVSMNAGASIAPVFGSFLVGRYGYTPMFYASSASALLSILLLLGMRETLTDKVPFSARLLRLRRSELYDRSAIAPAVIALTIYFCYGTMLTIIPDQADFLGLSNRGLPLAVLTCASITSRVLAGRISDRYGRVIVLKVATVAVTATLLAMFWVDSGTDLLVVTGALGFTIGVSSPAVFAWTIDRAADAHRGRAMGTLYIALEVGIGVGALASAAWYANDPANFGRAFVGTAAVAFLGFLYLQFAYRTVATDRPSR